jgi:hypothetical protein
MIFRKTREYFQSLLQHPLSFRELPDKYEILGIVAIGDAIGQIALADLFLPQFDSTLELFLEILSNGDHILCS